MHLPEHTTAFISSAQRQFCSLRPKMAPAPSTARDFWSYCSGSPARAIWAHFCNLYFCWIIQHSKNLLLAIPNPKEKTKACIWFIKTSRGGKKIAYLSSLTLFGTLLWELAGGNPMLSKVLIMGKTTDKTARLRVKATVTSKSWWHCWWQSTLKALAGWQGLHGQRAHTAQVWKDTTDFKGKIFHFCAWL